METKKEKSTELISYISHEIKNSLNPVINLSGIMLKEKQRILSNDEREYLEAIERNGRKILTLVDYLSYLNRSKTGKVIRSFGHASVKTVIENSVNVLFSYRNSDSKPLYSVIDDSNTEIMLDSESFKKIISCISEFLLSINNSVTLYFRVSSDVASLSINISGIAPTESGVPEKEAIPFFSPDDSCETSMLWYSLAGELISISGGESDVRQMDDGRVVWYFNLPVSEESSKIDREPAPGNTGGMREFILMVIDDDPDTLIPVKAIAEHEFGGLCKVVHACSGSESIDLLGKVRPDIILLDLSLPDINGMSLVRNIRNFFTRDSVAVIAFTGHDLGFNREKLINSGFDDIIIKPFHIDEFIEKIRRWIK